MRLRKVRVPAFGPFAEGERLDLAPGMTVVYGPNESGKSSWHAAIYAGLCGMRRGKGSDRKEDREFREAHRPWSGTDWSVEVEVELEDGRQVEIRQDLENRTDSRARDLALGRDVMGEIVNEGNPDAARWVGLDRRSFLGTACVRQTEVLRFREDPDQLQQQLQRAADTGGRDETAARAIAAIDAYRSEHLGTTRSNSTKPLRMAMNAEVAAARKLEEAQRDHADYMALSTEAEELAKGAAELTDEVARLEALLAAKRLRDASERLRRIEELSARFPEGPPPDPQDDEDLAQAVQEALLKWKERPAPMGLEGSPAEALAQELAGLPDQPTGDLEPHPSVQDARDALLMAQERVASFEGSRPQAIQPDWDASLDTDRLWDLIRRLETDAPEPDPALSAEVRNLEKEQAPPTGGRPVGAVVASAVGAMGVALIVLGRGVAGGVVLAAAALLGVGALVRSRSRKGQRERVLPRLTEARGVLAAQQAEAERIRKQREEAASEAEGLGLPPEVSRLKALASRMGDWQEHKDRVEEWSTRHAALVDEVARTRQALTTALRGRGAPTEGDPLEAWERYRRGCALREKQADQAARRVDLEGRLTERRRLEEEAGQILRRIADAEQAIDAAGARAGVSGPIREERVAQLEQWVIRRNRQRQADRERRDAWTELTTLLDGMTADEIREDVEKLRRQVPDGPESVFTRYGRPGPNLEDELRDARRRRDQKAGEAHRKRGEAEERKARILDVAEVEEAYDRALAERERLESLDAAFEKTLEFLKAAEDKVHRDVAPRLQATVEKWLPTVTAGRYTRVTVDPESLSVAVRTPGGTWQGAERLSHGTREQIYLLLRVALVQTLTRESCPILLDDVTVHSDRHRTQAMLDALKVVAEEHQVIVFSQEEEVLAWARRELYEPLHRVIELEGAV